MTKNSVSRIKDTPQEDVFFLVVVISVIVNAFLEIVTPSRVA